jgi:transcriptional regulator with XRE-family HTH domain
MFNHNKEDASTSRSASAREARVRIGRRLRQARHGRGLTIDQVAGATGLNRGFLSQVERDLATPSVASLLKICGTLDIRIGDLFDERDAPSLVRAGERASILFGGVGARDELLTPGSNRRIQAIHCVLGPGGHSDDGETYRTRTDAQLVFVLKGEFEVTLAGELFRLRPGDALTFTGREPRTWRNPSRTRSVELIWFLTPSLF